MTKDEIFEVVKKNVVEIMFDLPEDQVTIDKSLTELGANSIDRADIVTQSMEDLALEIPLVELGAAKNLNGLVDIFHAKQN